MSSSRVLLARHPETQANVELRYTGTGDTPLTENGQRQAVELIGRITEWGADAVLSSPSERCLVVARPLAEQLGLEVRVLEELGEMDFGLAEGLTYEELQRAGISLDLLGGPTDAAPFEGGEDWDAFRARVADGASVIEHAGERPAVVTHGGVIRALVTCWLDLPDVAAWKFAIAPAGVVEIAIDDGHGVLTTLAG